MTRTVETHKMDQLSELPLLEKLQALPREKEFVLVFGSSIQHERSSVGEKLKKQLNGFQVGIHTIEPEISIRKLITEEEIEEQQDFFERCAKEHRELGTALMYDLLHQLRVTINKDTPWLALNKFKATKAQSGTVGDWNYYLHGFHCRFENRQTQQVIEVSVVFGLEFGELDPYFFSQYIKSTPAYQPLPVAIYEDYEDGKRILKKMQELGKFEQLSSDFGGHDGLVVKDRIRIEPPNIILQKKKKFNWWRFWS